MSFDCVVLNKLLDKYENSVLSKDGSNRQIAIVIKANDPIFKGYWGESGYLHRDEIDVALENIEKKQWIVLKRDFHKEIESVTLNLDLIDQIYPHLKRVNPKDENEELLLFLNTCTKDEEPLGSFSKAMVERIQKHQPVLSFIDGIKNLKLYVTALRKMQKLEADILKRNFSKAVFNDSKLFEKKLENRVCKIIREFSGEEERGNEAILQEYHIVNTPTFVFIKGDLSVKVNQQIINLFDYGYELSLSSDAVQNLSITRIGVDKIITIENLTTFVAFHDSTFVCLYLGGFSNHVKRNLLRKIYDFNSALEFYHFGDIDAGGFLILEDLKVKTEILIQPYLMDENTLKNHQSNWNHLTENDRKRITEFVKPHYPRVANFMLENECKLEQESIELTNINN